MQATVHASCVAFGNKAVLIRGSSGSGKSDLVLQLIDSIGYGLGGEILRAKLIADDQVQLQRVADMIMVSAPPTIAGKLEIRGMGIVAVPHRPKAQLKFVIDLSASTHIPRMPEPEELETEILGLAIKRFLLDPAGASAAARIRALFS